jgi:hypothetical protein
VIKNLSEMKMNVKNGKDAVKPAVVGHAGLPVFISPLINGNYFCLEKHLSIASLSLWVYGKTHDGRDKKNSLSMRREKEFGSFIPDVDHLKNKLSITNKTMVIKQKLFNQPAAVLKSEPAAIERNNLSFKGGAITKNQL